MNYKKIYEKLIENAKTQSRKKGDGNYYEVHHILPRCFGGNNKKENLVLLTYKEHFLSHLLLIQLYEGKEKISNTHKNKSKSVEHKLKISNSLKGYKRTIESIKKGSDKLKNKKQTILTCPNCEKQGGTTMYRWHFENCKLKTDKT